MPRPFQGKIELVVRNSTPDWEAFLTGRNHHSNGFAWISESSTGFPAAMARD
jgi:arylsulfatase A-like enzyme